MWTTLVLVAAAIDPVLEAATAQQEKEQVVAVFAKARDKTLRTTLVPARRAI